MDSDALLDNELRNRILSIYQRSDFLDHGDYLGLLEKATRTLESESPGYRPLDSRGHPGGLIKLDPELPTILVPDLHGRVAFLVSVLLGCRLEGLSGLIRGDLQIVCIGDGFHGEARAVNRWYQALLEFDGGFQEHSNMDMEMLESLGVMEIVMVLKSQFPECFHFLKGNHENIKNEHGHGNYPFIKFVNEGAMVALYMQRFFGERFHDAYYRFEKELPVLAVGRDFLVSHAEPKRFFQQEEVVEYRSRAEVVEGLTWTDNGQAQQGSVLLMLENYLGEDRLNRSYYFGGHRPVSGLFATRAEGRYIQFHNPGRFVVVRLDPVENIELERDIFEIEDETGYIT